MSCVLCIFMTFYLRKENARRDELMAGQGYTLESYTDEMKESEREAGDNATVSYHLFQPTHFDKLLICGDTQFFRYTV